MKGIVYISFIFFLTSCLTAPDISNTPVLKFISNSKDTLFQGGSNDSLFIRFSFEDGDGDIGYSTEEEGKDIIAIDNRTGDIYDLFKSPRLPNQGSANGVEGEIEILVYTACCTYPPWIPDCEPNPPDEYAIDTLSLTIHLTDRAGNQSNSIITDDIMMRCK